MCYHQVRQQTLLACTIQVRIYLSRHEVTFDIHVMCHMCCMCLIIFTQDRGVAVCWCCCFSQKGYNNNLPASTLKQRVFIYIFF